MNNETLETTCPYTLAKSLGIRYSGDINLEYGGFFYNMENWEENGYADAVRVTDLDSACGFTGGVLIERVTVLRPDTPEEMKSCLETCGWENEKITREMEIEACLSYGKYDPAFDMFSPTNETVTTDPDSWEYDGWKAEKHVDCADLLGYVHAEWFSDF